MSAVRIGEISDVLSVTGETAALSVLRLAAPIAGRITLLSVRAGDHLDAGAVAARVISLENEAAVHGFAFLDTAANLSAAERARAQRLQHDLGARDIPLRAPFAAVVAERLHNPGEQVAQNDVLLELFDPQSLYALVQVPVESASRLHPGMAAEVSTGGVTVAGQVAALAAALAPQTLTVPVRITLAAPLDPPLFHAAVQVRITVAQHRDALLIPRSALLSSNVAEQGVVMVAADHTARRRTVRARLADDVGRRGHTRARRRRAGSGRRTVRTPRRHADRATARERLMIGDFIRGNRVAILGLTILSVAAGLWAASSMPVSIFPEIAFHRISLIARAGDLPVEQTLTAVTRPLENAVAGILGVETIRSLTTRGGAQLDLVFGWHDDMLRALQLVQGAMEEARGGLPAGTEMEARMLDTSAFPIVGIAVTSQQRTLAQLSDFVIYEAAPQLRTIPGVYRVELNGAKLREYALTVDPAALVPHHLDLAAVESAVRNSNVIAAGGQVRDGYHLALTVVRGQGTDPEGLLNVVVAEDHGTPVRLASVAHVEPSLREDFTRAAANGETAVLVGVSRQPSGNAVAISDAVRQRLAELAQAHPEYQFSVFYDQADLVREAVGSVRDSIAIGLVLAVGTIFFFIAHVRTTLVAAAVIPATVLISCIVLHALGMSFNLMTLGGIAAGIGLILDDAIVVVENFHRHRLLGEPGETALPASVNEITHALLGSTLTPVAVLLPLGLLERRARRVLPAAGGDHVGGIAGVAGAGTELYAGIGGDARITGDARAQRRAGGSAGGVAWTFLCARLALDDGARVGGVARRHRVRVARGRGVSPRRNRLRPGDG